MIIYLHGFNSAPSKDNEKVKYLSKLANVLSLKYDSFDTFQNIITDLMSQLEKVDDIEMIVGTSLGGFYAAHLAYMLGVPSVLINPSVDPYELMEYRIGASLTNYVTGEVNMMTTVSAISYKDKDISKLTFSDYNPLVLLDLGDELLDSFDTVRELSAFLCVSFVGGSHRFDHMNEAMPWIETYMNHNSYVCQMD